MSKNPAGGRGGAATPPLAQGWLLTHSQHEQARLPVGRLPWPVQPARAKPLCRPTRRSAGRTDAAALCCAVLRCRLSSSYGERAPQAWRSKLPRRQSTRPTRPPHPAARASPIARPPRRAWPTARWQTGGPAARPPSARPACSAWTTPAAAHRVRWRERWHRLQAAAGRCCVRCQSCSACADAAQQVPPPPTPLRQARQCASSARSSAPSSRARTRATCRSCAWVAASSTAPATARAPNVRARGDGGMMEGRAWCPAGPALLNCDAVDPRTAPLNP